MNEVWESKNQNMVPPELIFRMLNEMKDQERKGGDAMDDQERKSYECAKREVQNLMTQNEDFRQRIALMQDILDRKEKEIRNQHAEGDALVRTIQKLADGDIAEIQVTVRMKKYFEE